MRWVRTYPTTCAWLTVMTLLCYLAALADSAGWL